MNLQNDKARFLTYWLFFPYALVIQLISATLIFTFFATPWIGIMKIAAIYILYDPSAGGRLYLDATADLQKRLWAHKHAPPNHAIRSLPEHTLVYYEILENMHQALMRKREIKQSGSHTNIRMIKQSNPEWRDLSAEIAKQASAVHPNPLT